MSQNTSHAVMAQRFEAPDSFDDFPTPPWAARALCEMLKDRGVSFLASCHEPAVNRGYLLRGLADYFEHVSGADVCDYGVGFPCRDFLFPYQGSAHYDWIITNPPFVLAEVFAKKAIERSRIGCAMLCRTQFSEGVGRFTNLFNHQRPSFIWQFAERVPMVKGRIDRTASTATAYAWYVWIKGCPSVTVFDWIRPCRTKLDKPGDFDPVTQVGTPADPCPSDEAQQ